MEGDAMLPWPQLAFAKGMRAGSRAQVTYDSENFREAANSQTGSRLGSQLRSRVDGF